MKWTCIGHHLPSSYHDITANAQAFMTTQNLECNPKEFPPLHVAPSSIHVLHPMPTTVLCTTAIQRAGQGPTHHTATREAGPPPRRVRRSHQHDRLQGNTNNIQFQSRILNCLPIDIPCLQKLPTASVWTITGLTPSFEPPFKVVAIASPKYRDTAPQKIQPHSQKNSTYSD